MTPDEKLKEIENFALSSVGLCACVFAVLALITSFFQEIPLKETLYLGFLFLACTYINAVRTKTYQIFREDDKKFN